MNAKKYLVALLLVGGGLNVKLNAQQLLSVEKREKLSQNNSTLKNSTSVSPLLEIAKLEKAGSLNDEKFEDLLEQFKENCGWSDSGSDDEKQDSLSLSTDSGAQLSSVKLTQSSQAVSPVHIASSASKKNKSKKPIASFSNELRPGNDFDSKWSVLKHSKVDDLKNEDELQQYKKKLEFLLESADEVIKAGKVLPSDVNDTLKVIKKSLDVTLKALKTFKMQEEKRKEEEKRKIKNMEKAQNGLCFVLESMNTSKILDVVHVEKNMSPEQAKKEIKKTEKIIEELDRLKKVSPELFEETSIKETEEAFLKIYKDVSSFVFFDQPTSNFINYYIQFLNDIDSIIAFYVVNCESAVINDSFEEFIELKNQMLAHCKFLKVKISKLDSQLKSIISTSIRLFIEKQLSHIENILIDIINSLKNWHDKKSIKKNAIIRCEDCKKKDCCDFNGSPVKSFEDFLTENPKKESIIFKNIKKFIKENGYISPKLFKSIETELDLILKCVRNQIKIVDSKVLQYKPSKEIPLSSIKEEIPAEALVRYTDDDEDDKSDIDLNFYEDFFIDSEDDGSIDSQDERHSYSDIDWSAIDAFKAQQDQNDKMQQEKKSEASDGECSKGDTQEERE